MNLIKTSTYAAAARSIAELRNLRKVKLYPSVSAMTVVTYYRKRNEVDDYAGVAYILSWQKRRAEVITTIHNIHAPPAEQEEEEMAAEEEIAPPVGFQLVTT